MYGLIYFYIFRRIKIEDKFLDNSKLLQDTCDQVAEKTEGFSAREIANLAIDWQMTTYASEKGTLTEKMIFDRVNNAVSSKQDKVRDLICIIFILLKSFLFFSRFLGLANKN